MENLTSRAMLVRLSISQWTARKYDRKVSAEVAEAHKANHQAGRYSKRLVAREALATISTVAGHAREFHYRNTLPWTDEGQRILPAANYLDYSKHMREVESEFGRSVAKVVKNYTDLVQEARGILGDMFDEAEYPAVDEIAKRYSLSVEVSPLPNAQDFRVALGRRETEKVQEEIAQRLQAATEAAMKDLWGRLYEVVAHMQEKLKDKDAIFRNSLVENVAELCALLPKLNITSDPTLNQMTQDITSKLCVEPDALRKNPKLRRKVAKRADAMLEAMAGYIK